MPEPRFTEKQIGSIVQRMRQDRASHDARLKVRRMLIEMAADATVEGNGTGTNIPAPFNKSSLIIQTLIGEVPRAVEQYASMIGANQPRVTVPPVAIDRPDVTKTVDKHASEQERLLATLWDNAGGRRKQRQVTRSQAWGRVGWYFTLPRDKAWGLPDRTYYGDLSDDELAALKDAGRVTPEPIQRPEGGYAYAESGGAYLERRKRTAQQKAISARSLFTLDAYPPDVVYAQRDSDGVKLGAIVLEVPSSDCGPGSEYAKQYAQRSGASRHPDYDEAKFGLYRDHEGRIRGGVTTGGEASDGQTWCYTIFATRDEVYCLVGSSPSATGTLIWYAEHDLGDCPLVPAPGFYTDSSRPGGEYSSPMEAVFSRAPIINQLETLLTNVAAWNALGRFVIVKPDGALLEEPKTGDPVMVTSEKMLGAHPGEVEIVAGTPMQLEINADLLLKLLEFYVGQLQQDLPSGVATGQEGRSSGTAWGDRQMLEQQLSGLSEPVDNHAEAVKGVMTRWIHCMRKASERGELETVYAFALPGKRQDKRSVRGLIEFDPAHLVDAILVHQSSDTAQSRILKQQAYMEMHAGGFKTMRQVLEDGMDEEDARQSEIDLVAYELRRLAMYGDQSKILPNSALYDFAMALRGELSQQLMAHPPFAIATAKQMASEAMMQAQASMAPAGMPPQEGNPAAAAGLKQPGIGMPLTPTGEPGGGQIPALAPAPAGGV